MMVTVWIRCPSRLLKTLLHFPWQKEYTQVSVCGTYGGRVRTKSADDEDVIRITVNKFSLPKAF